MRRVAVITGGAGGMGLATARILGTDHLLVIADLAAERLATARAALEALGHQVETVACDITDRSSVDALFRAASDLGQVRAVIHSAGLSPQMADPDTILRVNALGTIHITEAFLPMASEGAALVNVASMAAYMVPGWITPKRAYRLALSDTDGFFRKVSWRCRMMPSDFMRKGMAYSVSKHFVIWYSKRRAADFGAVGARVVSVSPGSFDTAMGRLEEKSGSAEMLETAALKRFGRPEEIAEVLAFCASEKAGYLTGTDILCDGGVIAGRM